MSHRPAHFVRALYEGIAFSIRDLIAASPGPSPASASLLGGGAASPTWRQVIADVTGLVIDHKQTTDASFGAALLAGIGAGIFASARDAVTAGVRRAGTTTPNPQTRPLYGELFALYKTAQASLTDINHRLHALNASSSNQEP